MSTELTEIEKVREKRLAKGTWKAERRRLKALEREVGDGWSTGFTSWTRRDGVFFFFLVVVKG